MAEPENGQGFVTPTNAYPRRPPSTAKTWQTIGQDDGMKPGKGPVHPGSMPGRSSVTNLDLDVTENCNLNCVYCFKGESYARNMSLHTMKRALEWLLLASGGSKKLNCNFMGGEPTMRFRQIKEFVPWARRRSQAMGKELSFSMTTNLTLFTEEVRRFVDEYGFGVLMSIDGAPKVQDETRPARNGRRCSSTVEHWAKSMLRSRPRSTARATLPPQHVNTLAESAHYFASIGFQTMAVSPALYDQWTDEHFKELERQFMRIASFVVATYGSGQRFNVSAFEYYINTLIRHRKTDSPQKIRKKSQPCGAGKGYMMIDYVGDIWPCHRFDGADEAATANGQFRLGNIFDGWFNHALHKAFLDFDHSVRHKKACEACAVFPACGGYCPAANLSDTGSIYVPHDTYCRWTALAYQAAAKIYDDLEGTCPDTLSRLLQDVDDSRTTGET